MPNSREDLWHYASRATEAIGHAREVASQLIARAQREAREETERAELRALQDRFLRLPWVKRLAEHDSENKSVFRPYAVSVAMLRKYLVKYMRPYFTDALREHEELGNDPITD